MTQQTPKGKTDFCTMCRQNTGYTLKKQSINKIIKGVEYSFKITVAVCNECGGEMGVPGLIDRNIREMMNSIGHMKELFPLQISTE